MCQLLEPDYVGTWNVKEKNGPNDGCKMTGPLHDVGL
jgi:hypothetical protein